ncbi:hypothetical protein PRK78_004578 [Emydomyces testavorans]|uniref:N-acetyltransferase domain-containing protein n=1 Tax=Emydomyces testavorans TaxID=2070801 RepID=A0AAF0DI07_9EURO|nr:hypothetical protein PRK78_004578 [Emydomyces testavorans]
MASLSSSPTYQILPVEESDALEMAKVEALAFKSQEFSTIVFGGCTPTIHEFRAQRFKRIMAEDTTVRFAKVMVDGRLAAFAQWNLHLDPNWHVEGRRDEKNAEFKEKEGWRDEKIPELPPGANAEAFHEFYGWLVDVRRRWMGGQKHLLLSLLVTLPEFQGRGIGSALLRDGFAVAAEHNVPVWLEASEEGYSLYKRLGFEDVEAFELDLTKYGGRTVSRGVGMIRAAGEAATEIVL